MNTQSNYIIQKQVLEISASSSASNFEWERKASGFLRDIISPVIESCFRDLSPINQHLVIDKLELDLGTFTHAGFEKEAGKRLMELLNDRLRSYCHGDSGEKDFDRQQNSRKEDRGEIRKKVTGKENAQLINNPKALQLVLLHFLKHGRFPWWHIINNDKFSTDRITSLSENEKTIFNDRFNIDWIKSLSENELATLKETLHADEGARIRLVNHFNAKWINECLYILGFTGKKAWQQWEVLEPIMRSFPYAGPLFHQYFWIYQIEKKKNENDNDETSIISLIEKTAGKDRQRSIELARAVHKVSIQSKNKDNTICQSFAKATKKYIAEKTNSDLAGAGSPGEMSVREKDTEAKENSVTSQMLVEQALKEIFQKASLEEDLKNFGEDDALFVPATGIVILHPFLTELFKETELWDGENWYSRESPYRAIQLLSWLAFGETGLPEYQLLFFKILCGMDVETALPAEAPLTDKEINACKELLAAVILHWKALRNTSAGGLQQGFLQRKGKISQSETGYQITIERLAQDILLSHLPWGYSMIRLPWMEGMLNVTWF